MAQLTMPLTKPTTGSPGRRTAGRLFAVIAGLLLLSTQPIRSQSDPYARAESLVRGHQWDEALSVLVPLLKREPRNLKALNLSGLALIGKGDVPQANEYFKKSIAIDPGFVPGLKNLSIDEFNAKDYTAAEKHLLSAEKLTPADPVIHVYLGEISYRQQNYQRAAEQFSSAKDAIAQNAAASAHLAISYLKTNHQQKATELLDTLSPGTIDPRTKLDLALALDQAGLTQRAIPYLQSLRAQFQSSYEIGFDLVLAELETKDFLSAIQTAEDLINAGHETAELNNILAQAYEASHDNQKAFNAYRRAIALDPEDEENYLDLAALCMNQGSLESGMKVIDIGVASHPRSGRLIYMRGLLHAVQGDFESAETDFKLSESLAPASDLGSIGLVDSYLESGHGEQAIQLLRQRLSDKPNDPSLLYLLGEALLRTGARPGTPAYTEVQTSLEKSIRLNPNLCLPHISLGTVYLDQARNQDAVFQFEKARDIDPTERSTYSHLAVAYKRLGEPQKAAEVLAVLKRMLAQQHQGAIDKMKSSSVSSEQ